MKETFFEMFGECKRKSAIAKRSDPRSTRPAYTYRFHPDWSFDRHSVPALYVAPDVTGVACDANLVALAKRARAPLQGLEADLAWLAVAVYVADRCSPRFPYGMNGPAHWRRRIHLEIPVRDVSRWTSSHDLLTRALEFLTEDDWSFAFIPGRPAWSAELQGHFPRMKAPEVEWTSLFSGGLDSLAGALRWLEKTEGTGLFVSGQTNSRIAVGQEVQISQLRNQFGNRIEHVGVSYGFPDKRRHGLDGFESSQRTRAFVHTSLGAIAALMAGNDKLLLFENGFGALNLACDSSQIGSQSSRGTHPVFLHRMGTFIARLFENAFEISNPFVHSTKGQMLSVSSVRGLPALVSMSFSCDRFPNYKHEQSQCGCCPSCLIRRLSFVTASIPEMDNQYSTDIFSPKRPLFERELVALSKLMVQANSLGACLRDADPWNALCICWPDLLRADFELDLKEFRGSVISLLRKHVDEWKNFSSGLPVSSRLFAA